MRRTLRTTAAWMMWLLPVISPADTTFGQQALDLSSLTNDFKIPLWNTSFDLRGSFGYKDNVELSDTNRVGSIFGNVGGDFVLFRLPTGPWKLTFFASADDRQFFGSDVSQSEQVIIASGQAIRALPRNWSLGLGLNYTFQNQIMDVSSMESNQLSVTKVVGNSIIGRWYARKEFKPLWLELDLNGGRQLLAAPLDSFWQFGPRLSIGHPYGNGSEISLSYQWFYELFDTRTEVTDEGYAEPGTTLRFASQTAEFNWRHFWDKRSLWRTYLTLGYDVNQDYGSGYFNYSQYRLMARAEYRVKTWAVSAYARCGYYGYPVQTISPDSTENRRKTWLTAGLHAEKQLWKRLNMFADYAFDQSDSNVEVDLYYDTTVSVGFEWKL